MHKEGRHGREDGVGQRDEVPPRHAEELPQDLRDRVQTGAGMCADARRCIDALQQCCFGFTHRFNALLGGGVRGEVPEGLLHQLQGRRGPQDRPGVPRGDQEGLRRSRGRSL